MHKVVVLYPKPKDTKEFDEHYEKIHVPLAKKIPKLKDFKVSKIYASPIGNLDYYLMAELYFESKEDLENAMNSNEMREAARDAMKISEGKMKVMIAEEIL